MAVDVKNAGAVVLAVDDVVVDTSSDKLLAWERLGFDVLGAVEMSSGFFEGNQRSAGVSRAVGYRPNGTRRMLHPDGDSARLEHRVVLRPEDFVRPPHPVQVSGEGPLLRFLGL